MAADQLTRRPYGRTVDIPLLPVPTQIFRDKWFLDLDAEINGAHNRLVAVNLGKPTLDDKLINDYLSGDANMASMISHELSAFMQSAPSDENRISRTAVEVSCFSKYQALNMVGCLESMPSLLTLLYGLKSEVEPRYKEFRDGDIYTSKDSAGNRVKFPSPSDGYEILDSARASASQEYPNHRFLVAVLLLNYVYIAHPFNDGNGRVARVLFNLVMSAGRDTELYIPIKALSIASKGGDIIKTRKASNFGDWKPICEQFLHYYEIVERIVARG